MLSVTLLLAPCHLNLGWLMLPQNLDESPPMTGKSEHLEKSQVRGSQVTGGVSGPQGWLLRPHWLRPHGHVGTSSWGTIL